MKIADLPSKNLLFIKKQLIKKTDIGLHGRSAVFKPITGVQKRPMKRFHQVSKNDSGASASPVITMNQNTIFLGYDVRIGLSVT